MMKKNGFRIGLIAAVIVLLGAMAGCVSFDKRLMDPEVPAKDHAVLYFDSAINNVNIDGDETKGGYHSPLIVYDAMVMLAPGPHTITARYATREDRGDYYHDTSTGYINITHDFRAGGYYYMYGNKAGSKIQFVIEEDTDSRHIKKGEKKKNSASYPKKTAPAVTNGKLLQEAVNAAPTRFEGAWKGIGTPGLVGYVFEGNVYYYVNDTKVLSSMAGTGRDPSEIGIFEHTDTALIMTPLKKRKVGLLSLKSVLKNVEKPEKTEYAYTLDGDTFTLSLKGKPLGKFAKQDQDTL
ncbi:MAG: hypothetical protein LBP23_02925 [Treponema sp.]|jgi:hypothetical protein|nr:hypothetical protein [Treponema sp.]